MGWRCTPRPLYAGASTVVLPRHGHQPDGRVLRETLTGIAPFAVADLCMRRSHCARADPYGLKLGVVDLPMAPSCALDEAGLRSQLERYRQAGRNARLIERTPRRLVAALAQDVDVELVAETVAIERECCPFSP